MGTLKLLSSEFNEINFQLLAIHCPIEGYRLAFFINKLLKINLKRTDKLNVLLKTGNSDFERFSYEDLKKDIFWDLIENKNNITIVNQSELNNLFFETKTNFSVPVYLIPEFKKANFFLRIECDESAIMINEITVELKKINWITTVYPLNLNKIKSKNNLIF